MMFYNKLISNINRYLSNNLIKNLLNTNVIQPTSSLEHYINYKSNRKIPLDERYETVDFIPNKSTNSSNSSIIEHASSLEHYINYKSNKKIPLGERYETVDFIPKKK